jgi:chromosome segregation ATPase
MRRAIVKLSTQIDSLAAEVKLLRRATERNSQTMELLLYEERLAKVEEKLDAAIDRKAELDAREQDIQRRLRNIQQEVMLRGGLRRDETEAALRAEYQRALDDIKNQQSLYQQRISELQTQVNRLRIQVETLRKKLERVEEKSDQQQQ